MKNKLDTALKLLEEQRDILLEQLNQINNAIKALGGSTKPSLSISISHEPVRMVRVARGPRWSLEVDKHFRHNAHATIDQVVQALIEQGFEKAGDSWGRQHIEAALERMVSKNILKKLEDGTYIKRVPQRTIPPLSHSLQQKNTKEAILSVFRRARRPMHYKEIMVALEHEEGITIQGKNPSANMQAHLANTSNVVRIDKGLYELREPPAKNDAFDPT